MNSEWQLTTLGEICTEQGGAIQTGPFGSQLHTSDYKEIGIPVVMPTNIGDGGISEDGIARIDQSDVDRLSQHKLMLNDIVFSRRGDVTKNALIREHEVGWFCGTGCLKVRLGTERIANAKFISHCLRLPDTKDWLVRHAVGATMPNLNTGILSAVPINLPPISVQHEIAAMLGSMDDRITLLRETNTTLEAIAQALFKSWFVDFDPVHAKMQGRAPEGMDEATAALFPDSFEESDLGPVPKGWGFNSLDSIATFLNGLALQKFPPNGENDLPVIKIAQLRKGDTVGADLASGSIKNEYIVQNGDVLFSWSGSLEVEIWCGGVGALNQHLFKVTSAVFPKWFYFLWTRQHLENFRQIAASKATTMGHIQRAHLTAAKVIVPNENLLCAANDVIDPILQQIIRNSLRVNTLASLRDSLLPRLISGQLSLETNVSERVCV
ncbi:restriction endonuclease subunit S [Limnohabitans sp. TS-CS-82]|uniref:restriction endonuclease subunit S n=1 Tax=Limnohabitans sp. TS-CS-82 TaxID=2094193 RepID=UPI000CF28504|nr:restriction endonuclease subunit S [Limnohabitans sp. TS-CS-82]PQA82078.1 restriction endonuclease subunit S [Limnohabitans sp. TS-CS-82]